MNCTSCGSPETIVTDRIQTVDGTVLIYTCLDCERVSEWVPSEAVDRERDREMTEEAS